VLLPHQVASPLAGRPYDLRYAEVSLWLNAGVPASEAAERAGHSVDVLLKVYAKCIDGQQETANRRITDARYGCDVSGPEPGRIITRVHGVTKANDHQDHR